MKQGGGKDPSNSISDHPPPPEEGVAPEESDKEAQSTIEGEEDGGAKALVELARTKPLEVALEY